MRRGGQAPTTATVAVPADARSRSAATPTPPSDGDRDAALDHVADSLKQRIAELQIDFCELDSDGVAVLDDLMDFQSSMIRQPPMAAKAVLNVLARRNYSLDEVTTLIEGDPSLAQSLLRTANSAWYAAAGSKPVVSLTAATQRIGTNGVHATIMSSIMQGKLARPGAGFNDLATSVWDHMVRVAPIARQLAEGFGGDPEEAFTLGLSHDVGKLVLFDRIADLRKKLRRDIDLPGGFLYTTLRKLHEPLGALAVHEWGLSIRFASIIGTHHRDTPPTEPDPLSEALFVAERLDLAIQKQQTLDLDRLWESGALTTSIDAGTRLVEEATEAAEASLQAT